MNGRTAGLLNKEATRINSKLVGASGNRIRRELKRKWNRLPWPERHAMRLKLLAIN